jgi:hypothetical protein
MTHEELVARLERERISYPDDLPGERLAPVPVERISGRQPAYTPVTEERAEQNLARLKQAVGEEDARNRKDHW